MGPGPGPTEQEAEVDHLDELELILSGPEGQTLGDRFLRVAAIIVDRIEKVQEASVEPPRRFRGRDEVIIRVVNVATNAVANIVQGPDIKIPIGYTLTVRQRFHSGTPTGYVAMTAQSVQRSLERIELKDGEDVAFKVANMEALYFWSDDNSEVFFELIAEA